MVASVETGAGFLTLLLFGAIVLGSTILLIARPTRPKSVLALAGVLAVGAAAAFGVLTFSQLTDDAVVVNGHTIYCEPAPFDPAPPPPPPPEVTDRCLEQERDRERQSWIAASGAALAAAGAACLLTSVGPLARQTQTKPADDLAEMASE